MPSLTELEGHSGNPGGNELFSGCSSWLWDGGHEIITFCLFVCSCVKCSSVKVTLNGILDGMEWIILS